MSEPCPTCKGETVRVPHGRAIWWICTGCARGTRRCKCPQGSRQLQLEVS